MAADDLAMSVIRDRDDPRWREERKGEKREKERTRGRGRPRPSARHLRRSRTRKIRGERRERTTRCPTRTPRGWSEDNEDEARGRGGKTRKIKGGKREMNTTVRPFWSRCKLERPLETPSAKRVRYWRRMSSDRFARLATAAELIRRTHDRMFGPTSSSGSSTVLW